MLTKVKIQEQLDQLPEEFSIDELVERLILIEKVERGVKDADKGRVISQEEMQKSIDTWFK